MFDAKWIVYYALKLKPICLNYTKSWPLKLLLDFTNAQLMCKYEVMLCVSGAKMYFYGLFKPQAFWRGLNNCHLQFSGFQT